MALQHVHPDTVAPLPTGCLGLQLLLPDVPAPPLCSLLGDQLHVQWPKLPKRLLRYVLPGFFICFEAFKQGPH